MHFCNAQFAFNIMSFRILVYFYRFSRTCVLSIWLTVNGYTVMTVAKPLNRFPLYSILLKSILTTQLNFWLHYNLVLVNTKFRIMEILIMNSAREFISAIFATKRFCNVYNWYRCRGKIFSMGSRLDNS